MTTKTPEKLMNPFDLIYVKVGQSMYPLFRFLHLTPNFLTTISLVTGLLSAYFLYKSSFILAGILYLISYMFDCFDGNYARTFKMYSKFGDFYDHASNMTVTLFVILAFASNKTIPSRFKLAVAIVFAILCILLIIQLGCEEKYYRIQNPDKASSTLEITAQTCRVNDLEKTLTYMKWFSPGTANTLAAITFIIAYFYIPTSKR